MIAEALTSYAAACERSSIDQRPLVWATHFDIWNTERGDIGLELPDPNARANAAFAALIPFVLVPEIATSVLVLDLSSLSHRELALIRLSVSKSGIDTTHCWTSFGIGDDGIITFGDLQDGLSSFVSTRVLASINRIVDGRRLRFAWDEEFSFDSSIQVAKEFVHALIDIP